MFTLLWEDEPAVVQEALASGGAPDAVERLRNLAGSVLRLTNGEMLRVEEALRASGALRDEVNAPEFPVAEDFAVPRRTDGELDVKSPQYPSYQDACEAVCRAVHSRDGLPTFKLQSADGWLIYPDELAHALQQLTEASLVDVLSGDIIAWLRDAATHGGVRVF